MESLSSVHPDLVEELKQYVRFFDPSVVKVSFESPKAALSRMPKPVCWSKWMIPARKQPASSRDSGLVNASRSRKSWKPT